LKAAGAWDKSLIYRFFLFLLFFVRGGWGLEGRMNHGGGGSGDSTRGDIGDALKRSRRRRRKEGRGRPCNKAQP
jgi:hypothetical protein